MRSDLVDLATSDGLIGPDWTMNIEVCDAVNRDPRQAKEVVKSLKKKINSKNSKVQLLALTLLETLIKNCGDIVHMHVAERDIPHEMVKIVKKKPDFHVKEKILILIDTWQEVFGGPRARYPQYFGAYQELLNYGMVFPQRTENSAPIFTPPQTQPISHPRPMRSPDYPQQAHGSSTAHGISVLSLTEIQNARGIMDVLTEMLNALDPANREGLRQEVIIDLVQQCHSYKQRVVHLVNTTSDEALLQLSLSLNDDLERLLAKHDAIASGTAVQLEKSKPSSDIGAGKTKTTPVETNASTSSQSPVEQLLLPAQSSSDKNVKTNKALVKMDPHMDLLSGDDINAQTMENSLALVPVTKSLPISASDQNVLALADMFAQNDNAHNNNTPFDSHSSYSVSQATTGPQILKSQQAVLHSDAGNSNTAAEWNSQNTQPLNAQQQSHTFGLSSQVDEALPPPPWETPTEQNEHISQHIQTPPIDGTYPQQIQSPSVSGMYPQHMHIPPQVPTLYSYPVQGEQMVGAYQYPMQSHQMTNIPLQPQYLQNQMGGVYPYTSQSMAQQYYNQSTHPNPYPTPNDLSQRFHGFSMQGNSSQITASSLSVQSSHQEPSKPVDNFFGDLVSMAKSKPNKPPSTNQST